MAYNAAIIDYVCDELAKGRGLKTISLDKIDGMPNESVLRYWANNDAELAARYARARLIGNDVDFEQIDEWAGEEPPTLENGAIDNGWNNWNRTRIDTRKWSLAKRQPGRFGDKLEIAGEIGMKNLSDDQVKAQAMALLAKIGIDATAAPQEAPGATD